MTDEIELLREVADRAEGWMARGPINVDKPTQEAADEFIQALSRLRRLQRHGPSATPAADVRPCDYCGAAIFFAQATSGKWWPVEAETVPAKEVIAAWRYVVDFAPTLGVGPTIRVVPGQSKGEVWVNHFITCGISEGPRWPVAPLMRRWRVNTERADTRTDSMRESLLAMRQRFAQSPTAR